MIRFESISVTLGGREILRDIDLEIQRGETVAVIGLSGAGKSTLLKLVVGLLRPTKGKVWVNGTEMSGLSGKALYDVRKKIGLVFQEGALFDSLTVGENVAFGLRQHFKLAESEIWKRVEETLEVVGLAGTEALFPSQLSGGMRKRISLARALAYRPEILLFDEPTTGLDPIMTNIINSLILQLKRDIVATSIIVTHDMHSAFAVSDRVAMLFDKRFMAVGTPADVQQSVNPYVRQFIEGSAEGPIQV
ncbi:MAG: ABC transporter ATP-binding protein [Armatimonadetes bacterium]|nr:ABC transporter ATP-binding protein [Armatimonadota bacterium]